MRLNSRPFRIVCTLLLPVSVLAGVAALPTGASAAAPQHVNFSGTILNVNLCGINTTLTFSGVNTFTPVFDSSGNLIAYKDLHQETDTFTAANGQTFTIHFAGQQTSTITMNPDGTFTQTFVDKGLQEQLTGSSGGVVTADVGIITFVDQFDSSGNFLSQTFTVVAGPHPEANSNFTLFCQVVTAALT